MSQGKSLPSLLFRPIGDLSRDQQFELLAIRNQQIIRESSYSRHIIEDDEHLRWVEQIDAEPGRAFYAVFHGDQIVGGVGLRRIGKAHGKAEWSFYVSEATQGQGIGLALGVQALDLFFDELGLQEIIGEALADNEPSLGYHTKLGFEAVGRQQHMVQPENEMADIVIFSLSPTRWKSHRANFASGADEVRSQAES